MVQTQTELLDARGAGEAFPAEVEFIISALEAAKPIVESRRQPRIRHRVVAELRLHSDSGDATPRLLYTLLVNTHALGFLVDRHLPVSHGGVVELVDFDGQRKRIYCTILRCRQAAPGWYEGAVYFNREQHAFALRD